VDIFFFVIYIYRLYYLILLTAADLLQSWSTSCLPSGLPECGGVVVVALV